MGDPFSNHIALLREFLSGRDAIVDNLERRLFSSQGKAIARNGDRESVADIFDSCFFESPSLPQELARLNGQLMAGHLADGFEPARQDGYSRQLDPVELFLRACDYWNKNRWPGRNGRIVYAHSLYAAFVLRQLELLSLRIWDDGNDAATERLEQLQRLLDLLNSAERSPQSAPLVRDARWLIQTAQGPLTRHLKPYFTTAGKVAESFSDSDRLEIHKAGAVLAGGHLRSQLWHRAWQTGRPVDDPIVVAMTRSSSAMDIALLVRDLVPLLHAYRAACARQDVRVRQALADAIAQGLSADPELLLTRLDLLAPSTMIEDLFVDSSHRGGSGYTAMGEAHLECVRTYAELIAHTAESLKRDNAAFDPARLPYSPLGIIYGFCADLFSNMVLSTLRSPSSPTLSLEDIFDSRDHLDEKQTLAREWARLPEGEGDRNPFQHSIEGATQFFARMAAAVDARAKRSAEPNASKFRTARLYVAPRGLSVDSLSTGVLPEGVVTAQEHCLTSDVARARATGATVLPTNRLIADRAEGRFLACGETEGAWFGVSKVPLTVYISAGKDALLTDVPPAVVDTLRVVCPRLLVVIA